MATCQPRDAPLTAARSREYRVQYSVRVHMLGNRLDDAVTSLSFCFPNPVDSFSYSTRIWRSMNHRYFVHDVL